jgi:hypothetical protein
VKTLLLLAALQAASAAPPAGPQVWAVFRGTLPCEGCDRIDAVLSVNIKERGNLDGASFWLQETYRGGKDDGKTFESGGASLLGPRAGDDRHSKSPLVALREARSRTERYFRFTDMLAKELVPLDAEKRDLPPRYVLTKVERKP